MSTTLSQKDGASSWLMLTGMPSARRCAKASKENIAKKRGVGKKLLLTIRAVMLDEHMDLVAWDCNGSRLAPSNQHW